MPEQTIKGATPEMMARARDEEGYLDLVKLRQMAEGTYFESKFDSSEVSAIGISGSLGEYILCPSLARIMLLSMIDSPFLDDSEDSVRPNIIQTSIAAYILGNSPAALAPLFTAARFEERLPILERLAEHSAEHLAVISEMIEELSCTWGRFEATAVEWFEQVADEIDYNDAVSTVNDCIQGAIEQYHRIPDDATEV